MDQEKQKIRITTFALLCDVVAVMPFVYMRAQNAGMYTELFDRMIRPDLIVLVWFFAAAIWRAFRIFSDKAKPAASVKYWLDRIDPFLASASLLLIGLGFRIPLYVYTALILLVLSLFALFALRIGSKEAGKNDNSGL